MSAQLMRPAVQTGYALRTFATRLLVFAMCCFAGPEIVRASSEESGQAAAESLLKQFIVAFENLDIDAFMACFAEDASVFFPTPEPPDRFDGKPAIREHFLKVFAAIRTSSKAKVAPYHVLQPEDVQVHMIDSSAALVTFHLRNSERTARRTLVAAKIAGRWLVVHLHASNVQAGTVGGAKLSVAHDH